VSAKCHPRGINSNYDDWEDCMPIDNSSVNSFMRNKIAGRAGSHYLRHAAAARPRWNEKAGTHGPRGAISSQNIRTRSAKETGHEEA